MLLLFNLKLGLEAMTRCLHGMCPGAISLSGIAVPRPDCCSELSQPFLLCQRPGLRDCISFLTAVWIKASISACHALICQVWLPIKYLTLGVLAIGKAEAVGEGWGLDPKRSRAEPDLWLWLNCGAEYSDTHGGECENKTLLSYWLMRHWFSIQSGSHTWLCF